VKQHSILFDEDLVDLLNKMLLAEEENRLTIDEVLAH